MPNKEVMNEQARLTPDHVRIRSATSTFEAPLSHQASRFVEIRDQLETRVRQWKFRTSIPPCVSIYLVDAFMKKEQHQDPYSSRPGTLAGQLHALSELIIPEASCRRMLRLFGRNHGRAATTSSDPFSRERETLVRPENLGPAGGAHPPGLDFARFGRIRRMAAFTDCLERLVNYGRDPEIWAGNLVGMVQTNRESAEVLNRDRVVVKKFLMMLADKSYIVDPNGTVTRSNHADTATIAMMFTSDNFLLLKGTVQCLKLDQAYAFWCLPNRYGNMGKHWCADTQALEFQNPMRRRWNHVNAGRHPLNKRFLWFQEDTQLALEILDIAGSAIGTADQLLNELHEMVQPMANPNLAPGDWWDRIRSAWTWYAGGGGLLAITLFLIAHYRDMY
jgi:hypothetical protein